MLDDAYNANPSSMAAALEALARIDVPGGGSRCSARCGSSASWAFPAHAALGALVGAAVDALVAVGPEAAPLAARHADAGVAVTEVADAAAALDASPASSPLGTRCS